MESYPRLAVALQSALIAAFAVFGAVSCRTPAPAIEAFDEIVTEGALRAGFPSAPATTFEKRTEADQRIYALRIPAGGDSPEPYFLCVVRVSPGGTLLTRERWEERRRVLQATYPDRGPEFLENESPAIGLRALREPVFAGPGGASFGLAFTTHDALFDVQLTATNRAPDSVEIPAYDLVAAARKLANEYQSRFPGSQPPSNQR